MWIRHVVAGLLALFAGCAVSSGTFAFLLVIGVLPRLIRRTNLAKQTILVENVVVWGVIFGAVTSAFDWNLSGTGIGAQLDAAGAPGALVHIIGVCLVMVYGVSAGIFVGCIAAALAEILNTFPIVFHRTGIKRGLPWVMASMALGKAVGALCYFAFGYGIL